MKLNPQNLMPVMVTEIDRKAFKRQVRTCDQRR